MEYKEITDPDFYDIQNKYEFRHKKTSDEMVCDQDKKFELQPHQKAIQNFIHPNTIYNSILLYHKTGTGKTCSAISIAENFKNIFDKIYVISSESISNSFKDELIGFDKPKCAMDEYITSEERDKNDYKSAKKKVKQKYEFITYQVLVHKVFGYKGTGFKEPTLKKVDNSVIIVDEAHNLYIEPEEGEKKPIDALITLLWRSKNVKLVLATATPMQNTAQEIISYINLLHLNDKRIAVTEVYNESKIKFEKDKITNKTEKFIKESLKGYVSFVDHDKKTFAKRKDHEVVCVMKDEQLKGYKESLKEDTGFRSKSKQTSLLVFPENYTNKKTEWFNDLKRYSIKYYKLLKKIKKQDGTIFIYTRFVENSGLNILNKILSHNGYKTALITGNFDNKAKKQLEIFNSKENINGSKIKILLGSDTLKEGVTLKNVRNVHILHPHENLNRTEQIIGRAIRHCSHIDLPEKDRLVNVYMYYAIPEEADIESTDQIIHEIALKKQTEIDQVEEILKEIAWDCQLNNGEKCEAPELGEVNYDTYMYHQVNPVQLVPIKKSIIDLLTKFKVLTLHQHLSQLPYEKERIYDAIAQMIEYKELITINGKDGYLIHLNNYYLFQDIQKDIDIPYLHRIYDTNLTRIALPIITTENKNPEKGNQLKFMENYGNSCYVDTLLYILFAIPNQYITENILNKKNFKIANGCTKQNRSIIQNNLIKLAENMRSGKIESCINFKNIIKKCFLKKYETLQNDIENNLQSDPVDLLIWFIDTFQLGDIFNVSIITKEKQKLAKEIKKPYYVINVVRQGHNPFIESNIDNKQLSGIICNDDPTISDYGHYTAFILYQNEWYFYDDLKTSIEYVGTFEDLFSHEYNPEEYGVLFFYKSISISNGSNESNDSNDSNESNGSNGSNEIKSKCTKLNPGPPCADTHYEKQNKKGETCCYKKPTKSVKKAPMEQKVIKPSEKYRGMIENDIFKIIKPSETQKDIKKIPRGSSCRKDSKNHSITKLIKIAEKLGIVKKDDYEEVYKNDKVIIEADGSPKLKIKNINMKKQIDYLCNLIQAYFEENNLMIN